MRLLGALVLVVLLAEGGARIAEMITGTTHTLNLEAHMKNDRGFFQAHPYVGYVLRPGMRSPEGRMEPFSTNSLGFRGEEITAAKGEGTFRVACLGGSTTFGVGASGDEATWPAQLQVMLTRALPEGGLYRRVEVINAGVSGYTLMESFADLKMRVLPLEPDLVIPYVGINDARIVGRPNFRPDYTHVRRPWTVPVPSRWDLLLEWSHLYAWLRGQDAIPSLADFIELPELMEPGDGAPGLATWRRTLTELIAVARVSGCETLMTSFAHTSEFPERQQPQEEPSYRVLDRLNAVAAEVAHHQSAPYVDLRQLVGTSRHLFVDPVHLSDAGNALIARQLTMAIVGQGFLERPIQPAPVRPLPAN